MTKKLLFEKFIQLHTKKRNRLSTKRLNSLVYIMYNKKLKTKFLRKKALKEDEDPLVIDHLPSDDEWVAGQDDDSHSTDASVVTDASGAMDDVTGVGEIPIPIRRERARGGRGRKRNNSQLNTSRKG